MPHWVPLQVAAPFVGALHAEQEAPQVAMLLLLAQVLPQA